MADLTRAEIEDYRKKHLLPRGFGNALNELDHRICDMALKGVTEALEKMQAEVTRLQLLINTPELEDFDKAVPLECAHQVERWGDAHDRSKSAENWFWLVGYLGGKALRSCITGDREKALHHTVSAAAALRNWHKAIKRDTTGAGIGQDPDLVALDAGEQPEASKTT